MLMILESWARVAFQGTIALPSDDPDFMQQQLLLRMWCRYQKIFQEQQILLSNKDVTSFSRRVAAVMARMPSLKEIRFEDGNRGDDHPGLMIAVDREGNLDKNGLMEGVADYYPDSAEPRDRTAGDVPPFNAIVEIPIAAHQAGVRFDTIDIRFWNNDIDLTMFAKRSETRAALSLAFGQVRSFLLAVFNHDDNEDWEDVFSGTLHPEMLGLLGTPVLERLHLDCGSIRYDPSYLWGRGVLSEGAYSNLKWLHICGGTTLGSASDLHDFLRRLPTEMDYLVLERLNVSHIEKLYVIMEILRVKSYKKRLALNWLYPLWGNLTGADISYHGSVPGPDTWRNELEMYCFKTMETNPYYTGPWSDSD